MLGVILIILFIISMIAASLIYVILVSVKMNEPEWYKELQDEEQREYIRKMQEEKEQKKKQKQKHKKCKKQ